MRKTFGILILVMALTVVFSTSAFAVNSYLTQFRSKYGTGITIDSCTLCHPGGNTANLNQFATDYTLTGAYTFNAALEALDSDGDGFTNIAEITARTFPGDAASHPTASDTTPPTVSTFTIPATSSSLTVSITTFTATDTVGVTGYMITESATAPAASATSWTASAPTSFTASAAGVRTLYAWAKDAANNVSTSRSASVTITLPDATAPSVTAFTIPATSSSLTVSITTFTATDNVGVTGYIITESATAPAATATGWTASAPTSFTASAAGARTLYAWAKDAANNVSTSRSASVTITLPPAADTTPPTVTAFTIPGTSSSLTVSITTFTATDNVGVTGYVVTESATAPAASATGWGATRPMSYVFTSAGAKTLYAWAKDAAGNVSASRSASVTITLPPAADTTPPTVLAFTIPATSSSLTVSITSFTATDNVGVTGYMITESATAPSATATGWSATALTSYIFTSAGAKTLYAWTKDAAGNVSASRSASVTISSSSVTPTPLNDTGEFVKQLYRDFLNREAHPEGLQYWVNQIDSGTMTRAQVIDYFLQCPEFEGWIAPIVRLYFAYFLRIPDYAELEYWINQHINGQPLEFISDEFAASQEFQQRYGSLSNGEFVTLVYQNVLERSPKPGGYAYWVGQLNSGALTRGQMMLDFSESTEYRGMVDIEVFVTMMYVGMLQRSPAQAGFDYWVGYLDSGNSEYSMIDVFLNSQEYANRF